MVERIRTAEDHNDVGLGIPPFPRRCTELTRGSFAVSGVDLVRDHTLLDDTSVIRIAYIPSSVDARLYGPAASGTSRILPNVVDAVSTLGDRTISFKVTGHTADTSFEVLIWEY